MNKIRIREAKSQSRSCPWCREELVPPDEVWQCPRDEALMHRACAEQFGGCGLCRMEYRESAQGVIGRASAQASRSGAQESASDLAPETEKTSGVLVFLAMLLAPLPPVGIFWLFTSSTVYDSPDLGWVLKLGRAIPFVLLGCFVFFWIVSWLVGSLGDERQDQRPK